MTRPPGGRIPAAMRPRALARTAAVLGCALILAAPGPALAQTAVGKKELRQPELRKQRAQLRQLEFEKAQVRRRLRKFSASEKGLLAEVARGVKESKTVKKREQELARQQRRQRRRKAAQEKRIRELTQEIEKGRTRVAGHMRRLYRLSKTQDSATLISLARHRDFFRDSSYLGTVIRAGREAIRKHERLGRKLEEKRVAASETLQRLEELKTLLALEKTELKQSQTALDASLAKLRKNRGLYKKYLEELERTRQGMERTLVLLEEKSRRKKPRAPLPKPSDLRGRLPPPFAGRVIAGFGERDPRYDLKKFQRGLVIRVPENAPVSAVAAGRIVHAGPFRGYQELVVLDHGMGLFTVYGHLEKLRVERGGWAEAGAVLGEATYQPVGSGP